MARRPELGTQPGIVADAQGAKWQGSLDADIIIANAPDPVFVSDLEGKIVQANDAVSQLLGFRQAEVLEQSLARFISAEETREFTAALREVVERGVTRNARLNPRSASGEAIPTTLNASALRDPDGKVIGAIGILRDMRELDKARAYAESLVKNAPDPVFVSDLEGKILQANDAVSAPPGFRPDELLEQSLSRFISAEEGQIEKIVHRIRQVADSPLTVLVEGETGTGKELVARAVHQLSARREKPFIAVDCGAIPDTLIESELFGYEKGAFTGAQQRKEGQFELADGGTLFLDEIVNLPLSTQTKLLRALQERQVQRLGGKQPVRVDVRIIAASNVPLEREVRVGRFRQDVYYRLNEFGISLPPLRERDDILHLANEFLPEASMELGRPCRKISEAAAQVLLRYRWPGNVRELRNVIRRAIPPRFRCDRAGAPLGPARRRVPGDRASCRAGAGRLLSEGDRRGGRSRRRAAGDPLGPPRQQGEQERGGATPPHRLQDPAPQDEAVRH